MKKSFVIQALLGATASVAATAAMAQNAPAPMPAADPAAQPDPSDTTADAAIAAATPADAQLAQMQLLQAQVDAMQSQLEAMKAGLVKVTPTADKPLWYSDTKISGKAFMNVSSISHKTNGVDQGDNGTQTDVKRFYLTIDHKFDNIFSANLTTDFRYGANGVTKDVLIYVKKAYLQAKLSDALVVRVGAADLPWVPFVEDVYGYRYVENVLIDRTKYGTSTDWGVHVGGTFANGMVSYAVSAINGAGYKTLSRSSNTLDLEGRVSVKPIPEIVLAVGGYTGKLGKASDVTVTLNRATRIDAMAAYVGKRARLGIEYFSAKDWNNVTTATEDKTTGWSAFGSFAFTPKLSAFGRYDWVNPNKLTNAPQKENYFNVGVSYAVTKGVDLAAVYKRDKATAGAISTSNGVIGAGSTPLTGLDGTYDEFGLFTQIKF